LRIPEQRLPAQRRNEIASQCVAREVDHFYLCLFLKR
jgi:hypothetical protein